MGDRIGYLRGRLRELDESHEWDRDVPRRLDESHKWDRDIPYEKLKNKHTEKLPTSDQVEAVKYFVNEEVQRWKQVSGKEHSEVSIDAMIRSKLVNSPKLSEITEEYKKEMNDSDYQSKKRKIRLAKETAEYGRLRENVNVG